MNNEQLDETHCELRVILQYGGVTSEYDPQLGMKRRRFWLLGHIDDPYLTPLGDLSPLGGPDSVLHAKRIHLTVGTLSVDACSEFLNSIRSKHMGGAGNPCGLLNVRAGTESEKFEFNGKLREVEPITATLVMDGDSFETIHRQAANACCHQRNMRATITLVGTALPSPRGSKNLRPQDLDISANRAYGIKSFELSTDAASETQA